MTKKEVQYLIDEGFQIIEDGKVFRVEGDLWEYLDMLDEEQEGVFILEDLLNWNEEDLKNVQTPTI